MAYDVGVERVVKVLKVGRKYLTHIQRSLLEGELTQKQFRNLKFEVKEIINKRHDTVVFYKLMGEASLRKERLGIAINEPNEIL